MSAAPCRGPPRRCRHGGSRPAAGAPVARCLPAPQLLLLSLQLQLLLLLLLLLQPAPAAAFYRPQQNITDTPSVYCGFYDLQRYTTWCADANIDVFVGSNTSCTQYGVCIPLEGAEAMASTNCSYCSGFRKDVNSRKYKAVAACLVLKATVNGTAAVCDIEIDGPSVYDSPPPAPAPPSPTPVKKKRDWALWKTMTIIWSILGFAAFVVITVLLIRWWMKRRAQTPTSSPVTIISEEEKQRIEAGGQQQQQQPGAMQGQLPMVPGGPPDMTVNIRQTAPDGKPILAYGSSYPAPSPLDTAIAGNGSRLPPNAGDALLQAAVSSRDAYNGPPMRTAPVPMPTPYGMPAPYMTGAGAGAAGPGAMMSPQLGGMAGEYPQAGPPDYGLGGGIPAVVTPSALVPPTAATLQNPAGAGETSFPQPYR